MTGSPNRWLDLANNTNEAPGMNWRGRPLEDYETVVQLIGATKTKTGLKVNARLDRRRYRAAP